MNRAWEGNIRELENVIAQGILFSSTDKITPRDVKLTPQDGAQAPAASTSWDDRPYREAKEKTLLAFNTRYIGNLLSRSRGNVSQAARLCGMERQALQQIMRRYNIRADDYRDNN